MTARDVQQWLAGGVCWLDGGTPVAFLNANRSRVTVRDIGTRIDSNIEWEEIDRLSLHWPRCGSLNIPNGAIYLMRHQQQQYRRTYNPRALRVVFPDKWAMLKETPDVVEKYSDPMSQAIVLAAFNPEYPSWEDCMVLLELQPFVALNEHIILGGTPDNLSVFHKGKRCGTVLNGMFSPIGKGLPINRAYKLLQGRITVC
jgi:hypothetical protein